MKKTHLSFLCAAAFTVLLAGALPAPAVATGYPKLGLYGSIAGNGAPFVVPTSGVLDATTLDQVARYDEVILDVNPITPYRPDIAAALRQRNPNIKILAYVLGHYIWPVEDPDSTHQYPTLYRHLVRNLDGFLYNKLNGQEYDGVNVNLAKRDANGRFVVAEGLADLFQNVVLSSGDWDGMFFDVYCQTVTWTQDANRQIDYTRAGYPSLAAFDLAWQAGSDTLANRLRRIAAPNMILVGNCANGAHTAVFNGWMRENFPLQSGGTWYTNMLADPHGYFADDRDFKAPAHNYIFSALAGSNGSQYSSDNARKVRFGLASAALGEGFGVFGSSDRDWKTAPYHQWWYDEYGVDLATGHAAPDLGHTGWLGAPLGPARQMIWAGNNPDLVTNPGFESNVTTGWSFVHFAPSVATLTRDATTSAVGGASAHIAITTPASVDYYVNLTTTTSMSVFAGLSYSVTFWGKASANRNVAVVATKQGGGQVAAWTVALTPQWQQFQVILQPTAAATSQLAFFMGLTAGDVWLDDVHFQQGATNLYRRDFENGIVLVNPSDNVLQVPLGSNWKRILGTVDPVTNNGATISTATVGASDALFLLTTVSDTTPPAAITDARVTP